jgi:centromeric protein E
LPDSKRNSRNKEIKGNVIVSVRVRPDVAGQDAARAEGEWMVDGRRSLVAYRGREGGDYHYGRFKHGVGLGFPD